MRYYLENQQIDKITPTRRKRDYNLGFKLGIVEQLEKGGLTCTQARKSYGIHHASARCSNSSANEQYYGPRYGAN